MEKKFIGVIAVMLITCILIISFAAISPKSENSISETSIDTSYVNKIFNKNKVFDIYITLSESDLADMLENPKKEEYKQASVSIGNEKLDNVGFRVKGNSSLNMVADSESDRFSFKLDFDHYISNQNLSGLTKLNLNNSISDPSYMREYLSYSLLSEMSIATPAYAYSNVYINGKLAGLYLAVENIEEPFLQRYYTNSYGTLYKPEGQGSDLIYTDDNIESYSGIASVTERKNGSDEKLLNMIKTLNEGKDLEKYLDVDEILRYFAVNTVLVNMDSYQGNFKHNYYLYEENGIFSILPWDYNMSFGGFGMGGSQGTTSLYIDQPISGTTLNQRPLIAKLLEVDEYKALYHKYIEEFINGPFAEDKMKNEINRVAEMIRPYLEKDTTKFYTMEQFEQALGEGSSQQDISINSDSINKEAQNAVQQSQKDDILNNGGIRGQNGANRMMQSGNVIGLEKFIHERISNVSKQLRGELPTLGTASDSQTGNMPPQQQGLRENGQKPQVEGFQPPPAGDGFPGTPPEDMAAPGSGGHIKASNMNQYLYTIGGSISILLLLIFALFKKKTKYSL